tara:strand:- start:273 stop:440 length:168 start_codon:yes stop_codon:yes gene_type:complete
MDDLFDEYSELKAEAKACGNHDFPSFDEWNGVASPKDAAIARHQTAWDNDTHDLY